MEEGLFSVISDEHWKGVGRRVAYVELLLPTALKAQGGGLLDHHTSVLCYRASVRFGSFLGPVTGQANQAGLVSECIKPDHIYRHH